MSMPAGSERSMTEHIHDPEAPLAVPTISPGRLCLTGV